MRQQREIDLTRIRARRREQRAGDLLRVLHQQRALPVRDRAEGAPGVHGDGARGLERFAPRHGSVALRRRHARARHARSRHQRVVGPELGEQRRERGIHLGSRSRQLPLPRQHAPARQTGGASDG
jgi:hypothetical protein